MKRRKKLIAAPPAPQHVKIGNLVIHRDFLEMAEEQRIDRGPKEFNLVALRECAPEFECDDELQAARYWRENIEKSPLFRPHQENFYAVMLTTQRDVIGHYLVGLGTLDTVLVHPREVFQMAIVANAAALIVMHNHPSGNPTPSDSDIRATRDLVRAGQLLKIDLLDHIIIGKGHKSLRTLGHFYL